MKFKLVVDLQEGFYKDSIIVRVNGKRVLKRKSFTYGFTKRPVQASVKIEQGQTEIDVTVPTKNLHEKKSFMLTKDIFIGIAAVKPDVSPSGIWLKFSDSEFAKF